MDRLENLDIVSGKHNVDCKCCSVNIIEALQSMTINVEGHLNKSPLYHYEDKSVSLFSLTICRPIISILLRSSLNIRFLIITTQRFCSLLPYELHNCYSSQWLRWYASSRQEAKGPTSHLFQIFQVSRLSHRW